MSYSKETKYEPIRGHMSTIGWIKDDPIVEPAGLFVWQALLIVIAIVMIAVTALIVVL